MKTDAFRRLHSINPAEGVLFPFFDFGLLAPDTLVVRKTDGLRFAAGQDCLTLDWDHRERDALLFSIESSFDLDISGFDRFFVHGSWVAGLRVQCELNLDDQTSLLALDREVTRTGEQEFEVPIGGRRLRGATLRLVSLQTVSRPESSWLLMAGFANSRARERLYEPAFPEDWQGSILPVTQEPSFEPSYGVWFGKEDLGALRERAHSPAYSVLMDQLRADARACMAASLPECLLFAAEPRALTPDYTFRRPCEASFWHGLQHPARTCALVGLLDRDAPMLRYAARCAMALSSRRDWNWGFHHVPGTAWFGVPGSNANILHAVVETLDWAGSVLTPRGRSICWDAAMRLGVGHTLGCMSRADWLYRHNHGMHGVAMLCLAGIALARDNPHGAWLVDTAERMLADTLQGVFLEDGATGEGPGYWGNVVSQLAVIPALARFRGLSLPEYVEAKRLPPALFKTHEYFLDFLSNDTQAPGGSYIPFSDSGWNMAPVCRPEALCVAASLSGDPRLAAIHASSLRNPTHKFEAYSIGAQLLFMVPPLEGSPPPKSPAFHVLTQQGSLTCRRPSPLGDVRLNLFGWQGKSHGHAHEDKGSLILEVAGDCLLVDPGVTIYNDPRTPLLSQASHHNLLVPVDAAGQPLRQEAHCAAPILATGQLEGTAFTAAVDVTPAWTGQCREHTRRIESPSACAFTIQDVMVFETPHAAGLYFQSLHPIVRRGEGWVVNGTTARLSITPHWLPDTASIDTDTIDHRGRTLHRLCLVSGPRARHGLDTDLLLTATSG